VRGEVERGSRCVGKGIFGRISPGLGRGGKLFFDIVRGGRAVYHEAIIIRRKRLCGTP